MRTKQHVKQCFCQPNVIDNHVLTYQSALQMHAGCDFNTPGLLKQLKTLLFDIGLKNIFNIDQQSSKLNLPSQSSNFPRNSFHYTDSRLWLVDSFTPSLDSKAMFGQMLEVWWRLRGWLLMEALIVFSILSVLRDFCCLFSKVWCPTCGKGHFIFYCFGFHFLRHILLQCSLAYCAMCKNKIKIK